MNTNSIVMVVAAVLVALILAGVVAGFKRKFRAEQRLLGGASMCREISEGGELAAKAQAAQVDSGIAAFRNRGRRRDSADIRETADIRAQLKGARDSQD